MLGHDLKTKNASSLLSNASIVAKEGESQEVEALGISQANSSMFIATKLLGLKIGNTFRQSHSARRSVAHRSVGFLSQLCIFIA